MVILSDEERRIAESYNMRARQMFWKGRVPKECALWTLESKSVDWTIDFQLRHGLRVDGIFGPSCMIVMMSLERGGLGGAIIGGREVSLDGVQVARMFVPGGSGGSRQSRAATFLSCTELDRLVRDRLANRSLVRSDFSIDSSRGRNGRSLIIQWSDPCHSVHFCPVGETGDYPKGQSLIGIELETVLLPHEMDMDERKWLRRRARVSGELDGQGYRHGDVYDEQILALESLMVVLESELGISRCFPIEDGRYDMRMREESFWEDWSGYLCRFHYSMRNAEPGVGFVSHLGRLFGELRDEILEVEPGLEGGVSGVRGMSCDEIERVHQEELLAGGASVSYVPIGDVERSFRLSGIRNRRRNMNSRQLRAERIKKIFKS